MEEADKDPVEAPEPSVWPANEEAKNGVSTQEGEEDPTVEVTEESKEGQESQKRIISLQRDLATSVTNIQTAACAKALVERTELEEARRIRRERVENDAKSSQEKFEEITKMWSIVNEKVIPQELHKGLNSQQQLCNALIEDKKKLIHDLQQELKVRDDCYVKNLKKNAEELDLLTERMEDQITTLTKAYREELAETERFHLQEFEVSLTEDKTEWEQLMKELWDKELNRLTERRKKVEEYEMKLHPMMLESRLEHNAKQMEHNAKLQVLERKHQQKKRERRTTVIPTTPPMAPLKSWIISKHREIAKKRSELARQEKEFTKRSRCLSEDYKRSIQQYERLQKQFRHFAVTDARTFKEIWLMLEAEVKQQVEKALTIDSLICKQHLGVAWKQPPMAFTEFSGPIQPQKQAPRLFQTGKALQGTMDASVGPSLETNTESTHMDMYKEGTAVQSESVAEVEEETVGKVMELLCDEAGFLMEHRLRKLLAALGKEDQTSVKLKSLCCSLGIEDEDVPKLAVFLLKYTQQQREQAEMSSASCLQDVCTESSAMAEAAEASATTEKSSEHIHLHHVLPALKSFLEQRKRESSVHQRSSLWQFLEARDPSEDKAYWESMGNVISEDKLKLWDAAEITLKQYHAVLTDVSELVPKTERLRQRNAELRVLLQQSCSSTVSRSHNT